MEEQRRAEQVILKCVQYRHFPDNLDILQSLKGGHFSDRGSAKARNQEFKQTSALNRLEPFLDQDDVLRIGDRISRADVAFEQTHPVILPKQSHIITLVIRHYREEVHHQGRSITLNKICQYGYWIVRRCATISNLIRKCMTCRRLRGTAETQKMVDLPVDH